ncbi:MAG: HaeII family restriction endonuclease [Oscillospiraceae bacterium]|nr:HaeII family restriction endonuclease [Oscillospiraceae bacterium]
MANREMAKAALDKIIANARVHLYKPIQIAEILHYVRMNPGTINLNNGDGSFVHFKN